MESELVKVGHKYFTKSNDVVEVAQQIHITEADGTPTHHYFARVLRVAPGHEALMGTIRTFDAKGRWLNQERQTVPRCIHDLKEEVCHDICE